MKKFDKTKIHGSDSLSIGYKKADYKKSDTTDIKGLTIQDVADKFDVRVPKEQEINLKG